MRVSGKVFVVTGAGNGIGREVARELIARGARVAAVDRSEDGLLGTSALVEGSSLRSMSLHTVDLTDRDAVAALPGRVLEQHGQVDGLVHVAGIIQPFVPIAELSFADIDRVMAVNFDGTVNVDKAFIPLLLKRPEACLLNVSSMGALVPVPGQGAYGASKAAVALLTETLFAELQGTSVAVTLVYPGAIGTNIAANSGVTLEMPEGAEDFPMTAPDEAACQIVDAIATGRPRLLIGKDARMLDRMSRLMPTRAVTIVARRMQRLLGGKAASGRVEQ